MTFVKDYVGGQQIIQGWPLFGNATSIIKGAAIIIGTTDGTNRGFGIIAPTNTSMATNLFLGVTEQAFTAATVDNDPAAGTKYLKTQLTMNPHAVYEAQYDNRFAANALTIASLNTGTPSVTVTSGENIAGGWLFFDNGELHYVLSCSSGTYTLKSATTAAITTATKVAKIYYLGQEKITLITAGDKIGTATAAQGNIECSVLENYVRCVGFDNVLLDPTKTDNIIFPTVNGVAPAIFSQIQFQQQYLL